MSQFSNQYDAVIAALVNKYEELKAENDRYREALEEIKLKSDMCIFGTAEMDEDPVRAFRHGSHIAFNQCAHIAREALNKTKE